MNIISKLTSNPEVMAFIQENESDSLAYVNQNLRVSDIYDNIKSDMGKYVVEGDLDATYVNIKSYAKDYTINVMEESSFGDKVKGLWNKIPATLAATGIVTGAAAITAVTVAKFNESFAHLFNNNALPADGKQLDSFFDAALKADFGRMSTIIKNVFNNIGDGVGNLAGFGPVQAKKIADQLAVIEKIKALPEVDDISKRAAIKAVTGDQYSPGMIAKVWSNITEYVKQPQAVGHVTSGFVLLIGLLSIVYVRNKIKDSRK